MIQANELRLKNWAIHPASGTEIQLNEIDIIQIMERSQDGLNQNYEPIPLTTEWLTRAGFEKDFNSYIKLFFVESINRKGIIRIGTKECGHVDGFYYYDVVHEPKIKIEHVHQLQNLVFALTGTELEFK